LLMKYNRWATIVLYLENEVPRPNGAVLRVLPYLLSGVVASMVLSLPLT